ncbi:hypothetical protein FRC09_000982 [Ceratobasidium sp. 395]|nr:hypothetical protein FRC09_000982 [Ceratobasidium sp. 395]
MPDFFHLFSKDKAPRRDEFAENQWSCRGCGVTNAPIRYKCLLCNSFSLCYECHKTPAEHHSKHAPHNFALVIEPELIWSCNNCDTEDSPVRAKCRRCPDVDFCEECFTNSELKEIHPEHPGTEDFSWTMYSDAAWECEGCGAPNGDLGFRCKQCRDLMLAPQHHKLHPAASDYTPVMALTRTWICDGCEKDDSELKSKDRAGIRWDCKHCKDASLCVKCFKKVEKKHKKHPNEEEFTAVLYPSLYVPDEDSD